MNENFDTRPSLGSKSIADILTERGEDTEPLENGRKDKEGILNDASQVRAMRKAANLSQAELAERAGMSQPDISRIERGLGTEGPSVKTLRRLASACGFDFEIQYIPKEAPKELAIPIEEASKHYQLIDALFSSLYGSTKKTTPSEAWGITAATVALAPMAIPLAAVAVALLGLTGTSRKTLNIRAKKTSQSIEVALVKDNASVEDYEEYSLDTISRDQLEKYIKLLKEAS